LSTLSSFSRSASTSSESARTHAPRDEAEAIAYMLPPLLVAAEAAASSVALGVHGRRKAGMGETFWQFRRYRSEDPASAIDWRQSARSQHMFVREREWEVAETVRVWRDASIGMQFSSSRDIPTKLERATVLTLATASLLLRGGERVGLHGDGAPASTGRVTLFRMAQAFGENGANAPALPPETVTERHNSLLWVSDFLAPLEAIEARMSALAASGVRGFLVMVNDPAEEDFPYDGRVKFEAPDGKSETRIFGRAESVAQDYRQRFQAHVGALGVAARRLNWSLTRHRTDHPPQTALIALYMALGGARAARGF
jgi:uncharacterized protein (DUF58 family)